MGLSRRHIAKTITWRLIGSFDTIVLSYFISGDIFVGIKVGFFETFSKMFLYYIHERVWFKSKFKQSNKRHLLKTISWRIIGTVDTILLGWIVSGNPLTGLKIGSFEVVTKLVLYFFHEKLWYKINYGLDQRIKKRKSLSS